MPKKVGTKPKTKSKSKPKTTVTKCNCTTSRYFMYIFAVPCVPKSSVTKFLNFPPKILLFCNKDKKKEKQTVIFSTETICSF